MSKSEFKREKSFKVDDTFFKDSFDIRGIEDEIYYQIAKTMARNIDIDLAKTPLVDILTGYTRYKEAEYELQQKENIIKEVREYITKQVHRNQQFYEMDIENILGILDKDITKKSDCNYGKVKKENK